MSLTKSESGTTNKTPRKVINNPFERSVIEPTYFKIK